MTSSMDWIGNNISCTTTPSTGAHWAVCLAHCCYSADSLLHHQAQLKAHHQVCWWYRSGDPHQLQQRVTVPCVGRVAIGLQLKQQSASDCTCNKRNDFSLQKVLCWSLFTLYQELCHRGVQKRQEPCCSHHRWPHLITQHHLSSQECTAVSTFPVVAEQSDPSSPILPVFCRSIRDCILISCITVWFGNFNVSKPQVPAADSEYSWIYHHSIFPSIQDTYHKHCTHRASSILHEKNPMAPSTAPIRKTVLQHPEQFQQTPQQLRPPGHRVPGNTAVCVYIHTRTHTHTNDMWLN